MRSLLVLATLFCTLPFAAGANDTTGKLDAGGLVLARTDAIEMASEDLYISPSEVRVAYVFRNRTEEDVDTIVAFPMPDMEATPFANISVPNETSDNFLGFSVEVEGRAITPELEQRAFSGGLDVTQELKTHGIALFPYAQGMSERLVALPPEVRADWRARGMIVDDSYDAGQGMIESLAPTWTLKSTYWWRMTFPAGAEIDVRHRYTPSVGATVGLVFVQDGKIGGPQLAEYRRIYCMDESFERAVQRAVDRGGDDMPPYFENWISYVLTTGGNWAGGSIGRFKLTVDKGEPNALVSFCGEGVRKTGPTTFEMTAEDYFPMRDIEILLLRRPEDMQ